MLFNRYFLNGYEDYKLDLITNIILFTQENSKQIKKEYQKLSKFYKQNPEFLLYSLRKNKRDLDEKKLISTLTEFEINTLNATNDILNDTNLDIDSLFSFEPDFFLDSLKCAFRQLAKKDKDLLSSNEIVDIIYYSIDINPKYFEQIPIGERFSDGTLNTGSKIVLKVLKVDHKELYYRYQTICN